MRAVVRCVLAMIGIAACVFVGPSGVSTAAANQSFGFAIASVLPTQGEVVGVAHPVVVTFAAPSPIGSQPSAPLASDRRPR